MHGFDPARAVQNTQITAVDDFKIVQTLQRSMLIKATQVCNAAAGI